MIRRSLPLFDTDHLPRIILPRIIAILLIAPALGACKEDPPADGGCSDSTECDIGERCVDGECEAVITDAGGDGDADAADAPEDLPEDIRDEDAPDVPDSPGEIGPDAGAFTSPCEFDVDCDSGLCISTEIGSLCSRLCSTDEDCGTEDWQCRVVSTSGGDVQEICIPIVSTLCNPCAVDLNCDSGNLCVSMSDGDFCATDCTNALCPEGFSCDSITRLINGQPIDIDLCQPNSGFCGDCIDVDRDGYGVGSGCLSTDCDDLLDTAYQGAPEVCDNVDNNCDGAVDEGFDLTNSLDHCGACNTPCTAPGAEVSCVDGVCAIMACPEGFGDCDGDLENGCETETAALVSNCGTCGNVCEYANGTAACSAGECELAGCDDAWENCDGNLDNGCETDTGSEVENCGICNEACSQNNATTTCETGVCTVSSCDEGFLDCNVLPEDGCEIDSNSDLNNCGDCDVECDAQNGDVACLVGRCALTNCTNGFADCDSDVENGCEINVDSDLTNCGGCDVQCGFDNGSAICDGGECELAGCPDPWANCDLDISSGCETDTDNDPLNCNGCGNVCDTTNAAAICSEGVCTITMCDPGFIDCDASSATGCEIDGNNDTNNCGGCGIECVADNGTAACVEGSCVVTECDEGYEDCDQDAANGCEAFLATNPDDCGVCGLACDYINATGICSDGVCRLGDCLETFEDCNDDGKLLPGLSDGCEADLASPTTCGACDSFCSDDGGLRPATCDDDGAGGFECTLYCIGGFRADCDGDPANGCEVDLLNAVQSCGSCGNNCELPNTNSACVGGTCNYFGECESGWGDCNDDVPGISPTAPASDGCETPISNDVNNCGGCGSDDDRFDCDSDGGDWRCDGVQCLVDRCPDPQADCDGDQSSCEATLTDTATCGSCGTDCYDPPNSNSAGGQIDSAVCSTARLCEVTGCMQPYFDCDGQWTNGCEANTESDLQHCGGCTTAFDDFRCELPNAVTSCQQGLCDFIECEPVVLRP